MTKTEVCTTVLSHVFHLPQFLSLSDGDEKRPLALSAIPTEIRQGEEHPVSTVSPLNTLPEVRTTNNPSAPATSPLILPTLPVILTAKCINSHLSCIYPLAPAPQVRLQPLERWGDVTMAVGHYLTRYREDCGPLQLDLSTDTLKTLVQLHRTLKCPRWGRERVAFIYIAFVT